MQRLLKALDRHTSKACGELQEFSELGLIEVPEYLPKPEHVLMHFRDTLAIDGVDPPVLQVNERCPS